MAENLHRVVVVFEDGVFLTQLTHPKAGCQPTLECGECYANLTDSDSERCDSCKGWEGDECWVQGWFDNLDATELLHGKVELIVDPEWDGDVCRLHVVGTAIPAAEGRT